MTESQVLLYVLIFLVGEASSFVITGGRSGEGEEKKEGGGSKKKWEAKTKLQRSFLSYSR